MPYWRPARPEEDDAIVAMSLALYEHRPPPDGVTAAQVRSTLDRFRRQPVRGRAVVLDVDGDPRGYAFLVSFWSNELGGEICTIDEVYVRPDMRSRGYASQLLAALHSGDSMVWADPPIALELEVAPGNLRARALYERIGFREKRNATLRLAGPSTGLYPADIQK